MKTFPFEAVIFDLDGTLRISQPRFMDALHEYLQQNGKFVSPKRWKPIEAWIHYYWARSPEIQEDVQLYGDENVWNRFMYRLLQKAGYPVSEEEATRIAADFLEVYTPTSVLMPGAQEALAALRSLPVVLGVLSNRRHAFEDELRSLGIREYFDFLLPAGELGVWKPHPEIFLAALERAGGVPPHKAVYIGDNYYADIKGARGVGMHAILVDDRDIFQQDDVPKVRDLRQLLPVLHSLRPLALER